MQKTHRHNHTYTFTHTLLLLTLCLTTILLIKPPIALSEEKPFTFPINSQIINSYTENVHRGIDLAVKTGTEIKAAGDGRVSFCGFTPAGGSDSSIKNTISIEHSNNFKTTYLGLAKIYIMPGSEIKKGQVIGESGSFIVDGQNHLHFGLKKGSNQYLDPLLYCQYEVAPDDINSEAETNPNLVLITDVPERQTFIEPARKIQIENLNQDVMRQSAKPQEIQSGQIYEEINKTWDQNEVRQSFKSMVSGLKLADQYNPDSILSSLQHKGAQAMMAGICQNGGFFINNLNFYPNKQLISKYIWFSSLLLASDFIRRKLQYLIKNSSGQRTAIAVSY